MSSYGEAVRASEQIDEARVVTEAAPPYRIVYANKAWCETTGYSLPQLVGQTCRLLQGPGTCQRTLQVLHESLREHRGITVRLINFRADGSPFINDLTIVPLFEPASQQPSHFLGVTRERPLPSPSLEMPVGNPLPGDLTGAQARQFMPMPMELTANGSSSASGADAASGTARQVPSAPPLKVPTKLQEALQQDGTRPQLISEREPPFKTIHVNAAWCRQCGYRADDLIGRPYSMLLGPSPSLALVKLLESAFSTGQQVTTNAVYFSKSGLPWQAELTLAPLLDSSGCSSSYFVHLLRPTAETAVIADAEPRVESTSSSNKSPRRSETKGDTSVSQVPPGTSPPGGHSVIPLTGLSSAVQAGHKGGVLASHYTLPGKHSKGSHRHHNSTETTAAALKASFYFDDAERQRLSEASSKRGEKRPRHGDAEAPSAGGMPAPAAINVAAPLPTATPAVEPAVSARDGSEEATASAVGPSSAVVGPSSSAVASDSRSEGNTTPPAVEGTAGSNSSAPEVSTGSSGPGPSASDVPPSGSANSGNSSPPFSCSVNSSPPMGNASPSLGDDDSTGADGDGSNDGDLSGISNSSGDVDGSGISNTSADGDPANSTNSSNSANLSVGSSMTTANAHSISDSSIASLPAEGKEGATVAGNNGGATRAPQPPTALLAEAQPAAHAAPKKAKMHPAVSSGGSAGARVPKPSAGGAADESSSSATVTEASGRADPPVPQPHPQASHSSAAPSPSMAGGGGASGGGLASMAGGVPAEQRLAESVPSTCSHPTLGPESLNGSGAASASGMHARALPGVYGNPTSWPMVDGAGLRSGLGSGLGGAGLAAGLGGGGVREQLLLAQYAIAAEAAMKGLPVVSEAPAASLAPLSTAAAGGLPSARLQHPSCSASPSSSLGMAALGGAFGAGIDPALSAHLANCSAVGANGIGGLSASLSSGLPAAQSASPHSLQSQSMLPTNVHPLHHALMGGLGGGLGGGFGAGLGGGLASASTSASGAPWSSRSLGGLMGHDLITSNPAAAVASLLEQQQHAGIPALANGAIAALGASALSGTTVEAAGFMGNPPASSHHLTSLHGAAAALSGCAAPNASSGLLSARPGKMGHAGASGPASLAQLTQRCAAAGEAPASRLAPSALGASLGVRAGGALVPVSTGAASSSGVQGDAHGDGPARPVGTMVKRIDASAGATVRVPPFLTKLYTIMQEALPEDYAGWCADGESFRISDPQKFADYCLPRYFKHNKLGSFQQQLLTYGFSRVPNESCLDISAVWRHSKFCRGRPELLEQIPRSASKRPAPGTDVPRAGAAQEEEDDDNELHTMQTHLGTLTKSLHNMHKELRSARSHEIKVLDQLVERVDKRLQQLTGNAPPSAQLMELKQKADAIDSKWQSSPAEPTDEFDVPSDGEHAEDGIDPADTGATTHFAEHAAAGGAAGRAACLETIEVTAVEGGTEAPPDAVAVVVAEEGELKAKVS